MHDAAENPTRYAPDWYETAIWLATLTEGAHDGEVRLYRAADGRYFLFHLEPAASTDMLSEYPAGQEAELSVHEARALYARSAGKRVAEDDAFPRQGN